MLLDDTTRKIKEMFLDEGKSAKEIELAFLDAYLKVTKKQRELSEAMAAREFEIKYLQLR